MTSSMLTDFVRRGILLTAQADSICYLFCVQQIVHDCPILPKILSVCRVLAGGSIKAAQCLASDSCHVSVNWQGGWHHAQRDQAAGFCYVNDVVLAILELKKTYSHVLYLDLDIHHGNGLKDLPKSGEISQVFVEKLFCRGWCGKCICVHAQCFHGLDSFVGIRLLSRIWRRRRSRSRTRQRILSECSVETWCHG